MAAARAKLDSADTLRERTFLRRRSGKRGPRVIQPAGMGRPAGEGAHYALECLLRPRPRSRPGLAFDREFSDEPARWSLCIYVCLMVDGNRRDVLLGLEIKAGLNEPMLDQNPEMSFATDTPHPLLGG